MKGTLTRQLAAVAALTWGIAAALVPAVTDHGHTGGGAVASHGAHASGQPVAPLTAGSKIARVNEQGSSVGPDGRAHFVVDPSYRTPSLAATEARLGITSGAAADAASGAPQIASNFSASGSSSERATRAAALTKKQATKKLSKSCQKLINAKKPSKLKKSDKKKRATCIKKRDKLIKDSKAPAPGTGTNPDGNPAPGGTPAPQPNPNTPAPTTPTPPTLPDPQTNEQRCTDKNPATKCYAAVGVRADDGDVPFVLSRGEVTADIVSFELENADRQIHNLLIGRANTAGTELVGQPDEVVGDTEGGERGNREVTLTPGTYLLICSISGHDPMTIKFVVKAPATT